jgi:hypothetical protein
MATDQTFVHSSNKTAGGDPMEGADPGGTRSTKPGQPNKSSPKAQDPKVQQTVTSGDRNTKTEARSYQPKVD